jgi:tetratricopeptide (TPR) repeat protein
MRRALLIAAAVVVLGVAIAIPGADARPASTAVAADTAIVTQSIAFFEAKLANDPRNAMIANRLADRYVLRFQTGARLADLERAEALGRLNASINRDTAASLSRLSSLLLMQHKFGESYRAAELAVSADPGRQGAIGALYDAAIASGRYDVAATMFDRLERGTTGWRIRHAQRLDAFGSMDSAYREMAEACRTLENSGSRPAVQAWCLTELATIEHNRAGPDAMAKLLDRALAIQPGYRGALEKQADLFAAEGKYDEAREIYERIVAAAHPDLWLRLSEIARREGVDSDAARWEGRFLEVARRPDVEALYAHPLALYYAERPVTLDTARAIALRDLDRRQAVEGWDILAWIEYKQGDMEAALAASDHAFSWGAANATRKYHRARILSALGRSDEADALMASALEDETLLEPHARLDRCSSSRCSRSTTPSSNRS